MLHLQHNSEHEPVCAGRYNTELQHARWYNTSMFVGAVNHYSNQTMKTGAANSLGLFYVGSLLKLTSPNGTTNDYVLTGGWGRPNWNFTVTASSGDSENVYPVNITMAQTPPPTEANNGEPPTCKNVTSILCNNCQSQYTNWARNFTYGQVGTWYYRYYIGSSSPYTFDAGGHKITLTEDNTNISYIAGNNTEVIKDSQPQRLIVQVYDKDAQTLNLTP